MGTEFPKLSKMPLKIQEDVLDNMSTASARMIKNLTDNGDVIEIDGSIYNCHPAVSELLNSLWEQIEGMKESITSLEDARN